MSTPRKPATPAQPPESPAFAVPRAWLIALTVLIVVPWLVAGAVYWWPSPEKTTAKAEATAEQQAEAVNAGRWGKLDVTTVVISPPVELIGNDWGRSADAGDHWFFPNTTQDAVAALLSGTGLDQARLSALMSTARTYPVSGGTVLNPSLDLLRSLSPDVRAQLFVALARTALNGDQVNAFRYRGDSVEDWLGPTLISPATRRFIEPLIYRYGQHLYFADTSLVRAQITDPEELRRLAKALLRQQTARVRLQVSTPAEVSGLAEYWGRGGRRTDIRPLLESIVGASADRSLDIVHLLPAFAREHLYRYPQLTAQDLNRTALANCLWTALNFFNNPPDNRYLELQAAVDKLQRDYYLVDNTYELGDIVALLDEQGNIFHAVVYLAGNLVFTKNGTSPMAPWVILPLDTVVDYYKLRSASPKLLYHRRKDF